MQVVQDMGLKENYLTNTSNNSPCNIKKGTSVCLRLLEAFFK